MKKTFLIISLFVLSALACDLTVNLAPPTSPAPPPANTVIPATAVPTQIPATAAPTQIPATITAIPATAVPTQIPVAATAIPATAVPTPIPASPTPIPAVEVSVGPLSVVLPPGLASGARGSQMPRAEGQNVAACDITPGHTVLKLEGYQLQGNTHQPQIYVYPAMPYVEMVPAAFESIHRLDNILYGPGGVSLGAGPLPTVPFFNTRQVISASVQTLSFQNGGGVRFVSQYAQAPVSVNNQDLFYQYQGVTRDGAYYVVAIFPVSVPVLAETGDPGAVVPPGGIAYPDLTDPNADMPGYYRAVTDLLNTQTSDRFTPNLSQLDALMLSMRIAP